MMPVKVLIADDEPDLEVLVCQRFRKQIRDGEYDFVFARNGQEALERLQADPDIEVLMTDINMPVMDGLTLLTRLADLPFALQPVVVSAYGDMVNIRTAMNRGAFDFLTKPIDFHDFELTLSKSLRHVRMLKQAARSREELAALERELSIATMIQRALLPRQMPSFSPPADVTLHATMLAARSVGGDFYDYFALGPDRLGVVVGDVSGKGVPAALFMAMCRTVLRAVALKGEPPGDSLREVNAVLSRDNDSQMFVTLFYGILDVRSGEIQYGSAGHNPPFVVSPTGSLRALEAAPGDTVLGVLEGLPYHTSRVALGPGDLLFLYTDGVTEARSPDGGFFSCERLQELLRRGAASTPEALVCDAVAAVQSFADGDPQSDDVTVVAVRFGGAGLLLARAASED
jgi:sigma-B regulation protein RsbU (phosphoserine phosphatase)